jgi:hypothetical protein
MAFFGPGANAQEVVAAESGVIHYSEGAVLVDDVPLDRKPATFPLLKDGSVLRTQKGRVELMLTPGTFLRLDENSSVKMLSNALTSTTVEFIAGSAILDALAAEGDIPVLLRFKDASISFSKPGVYRIDSDTGVLQAYSGAARVKQRERETPVDPARLYFFELATDTKKFGDGTNDEFLDWARNRDQVITAENQAAQADNDDNADSDLSGAPLPPNFNLPYGGLSTMPGFPSPGTVYPYSGLSFNNYAISPFWTLPPLPAPALIIGRRWAYRSLSPTSPRPGTWASRHVSPTRVWPISPRPTGSRPNGFYSHPGFPRPVTTYPRPVGVRPMTAPRPAMPAARVGRR